MLAAALAAWAMAGSTACAGAVTLPNTAPAQPEAMPRRVVSLDLCTDEMLAAYGAREPGLRARVAALSPLWRRLRGGRGVPGSHRAGAVDLTGWPVHDGSLEQILGLHPDLALVGPYNALLLRQRLTALGVRVQVLPLPQRLSGIAPYEQRLLAALGLPASLAARADGTDGADAPPNASPNASPDPPQNAPRLLLLGANGIGTGTQTLEGDILTRAGWRNYVQAPGYVALDLERVATDPPDAVLWAAPASPALANRFAEHPAMQRAVPASRWLTLADAWRWACPGPWSWDLVRELSRAREQLLGERPTNHANGARLR